MPATLVLGEIVVDRSETNYSWKRPAWWRLERYRILRIYAKGAVLREYKLERILSHVSKFIQMESITQICSVWDNIGEDNDPDKKWRSPFENFGK